jgi:hypothetical protein
MAAGAGILVIAAATLLGVIATIVTKKDPGTILGILIVIGAIAAAFGVRYSTAYILIPLPALAWVAGAVVSGYVHDRSLLTGSIGIGSQAAVWMAAGFTWMVIAIIAVIVVAAGRYLWARRNRMFSPRPRPAPAGPGGGLGGARPPGPSGPGGPGGAPPAPAFRETTADATARPSRGPAPRFTPASAADQDRPAPGRPAPGSGRSDGGRSGPDGGRPGADSVRPGADAGRPGPDGGRSGPDAGRRGYGRPSGSAPPLPGDTRRSAKPRPSSQSGASDSDDDAYRRFYKNDDTWR